MSESINHSLTPDRADLIAEKDRWPDDSLVGRLATALAQSEHDLSVFVSSGESSFGHIILRVEILKIEESESWEIPEPYHYLSLDNAEVIECVVDDPEWLSNEVQNGDMFTAVSDSIRDSLQKHLGVFE